MQRFIKITINNNLALSISVDTKIDFELIKKMYLNLIY